MAEGPMEKQAELIVKLRHDAQPTITRGAVEMSRGFQPRAADAVAKAGARLVPLFGGGAARLRAQAARLAAPAADVPDLSRYYKVVDAVDDLQEVAAELRQSDAVEAAYVKPAAELATLNEWVPTPEEAPPATPDYNSRQIYLDAAPSGIDARYAWTLPGGSGAGSRIIDIEGAWRFTHEDLLANQGGVIGGTQSADIRWRNHGTAVVGEFGGDRNGHGVVGICPDANVRAISIFGAGMGSATAIKQAADALSAGDVLLIELHRPGPRFAFANRNDQRGFIAIEWWPDDFEALLYATQRGVIVVEAAGNGAEDLDDAIYQTPDTGFPASWTNAFRRANRDCGAILVGAGAPPPGTHGRSHGADRSRLDFSNYGASVDAQGWGREVTTVGYGDLQGGANEDFWYTDQFSGTSSASPIVVGALASLQGILRARSQSLLTPARARACLRATGSPQENEPGRPTSQRIGNRPDLRAMVAWTAPKAKESEKIPEGGKWTKDLKDRLKDLKDKDLKDRLKDLKDKDLKDKELKDKELKEKELKEKDKELKEKDLKEKDKDLKEHAKDLKEKDLKEHAKDLKEKDVFETNAPAGSGDDVASRLGALEQSVGALLHFIGSELRPDLSGARGGGAQEAEKQVVDAKGDVDKPREG